MQFPLKQGVGISNATGRRCLQRWWRQGLCSLVASSTSPQKTPTTYTRVHDFGPHTDSIFRGRLIRRVTYMPVHRLLQTPLWHDTMDNCSTNAQKLMTRIQRWMVRVYSVSQKNPTPLRFSDNFFQTDGNFLINFYTPITRSFLH